MDADKKKRLEEKGWTVGSASDFLGSNETEKEILSRFKKPSIIKTEEEHEVLKDWALVGAVRLGVDMVNGEAEAVLTKKGKHLLKLM